MEKPKLGWFERKFYVLVKNGDAFFAVNKNSLKKRLNLDEQQSSDIFNSASPQEALRLLANAVNQKAAALVGGALPGDKPGIRNVDLGREQEERSLEEESSEEEHKSEVQLPGEPQPQVAGEPSVGEIYPSKQREEIGPVEKELHEKWTAAVKELPSKPEAVLAMLSDDLAGVDTASVKRIVNADVGEGLTALHLAVQMGGIATGLDGAPINLIQSLIAIGADVDTKGGKERQTPFQLAVQGRRLSSLLFKAGIPYVY